ncbi:MULTISPECIES: SDR family oxidoreductase [Clostridium]|uniref:SDR family oxidoreductase n=3 Tax=Clostridium TaxID=1485 RepID=A0A3M0SX29_9CLOT|nr:MULTISPECIES: SDR family oxidoreductase [Clostridium]AGY74968.1 SDR family oxidoreductase [Clostridium autoethanogenum DSM 10061]ALU35141.1 Short-chain dehydrogenase/reductase SDR [Clostridium autoethanogenum DSM 10061]OAA86602.1 Serine 3-dehydrogenase [Clostridium ljungdahlii DSM 13528]OVY49359.1 Serine 3-dehydrogenase [Clostridium autoethanogenum]RMD03024.1 SDR family oxidoreductase [Clostridium autoethanogenum]
MKTAIVTGASSGIGFEIAQRLLNMGYKVYGFGRDFSKVEFDSSNFIREICDITNTNKFFQRIDEIKAKGEIFLLVNNAGVGYFGPHEELNPRKIHEMITVNLEVPMVLCSILMRQLKKNKGVIINISSVTAKEISTYGCAYSATKAGLTHFSESLFSEVRKTGVKIITIHPDMTKSNFYRNANFSEDDSSEDFYISCKDTADVVEWVLREPSNLVVTELTLKPQKHRIKRK